MALFHQRDEVLGAGDTIQAGRWGSTVLAGGQTHPFFFREQFLELWRVSHTSVQVSRLACNFAFEDRMAATEWAADDGSHCYVVEPVDPSAPQARMDMLWLTWMGERESTFDRTVSQCRAYWEGRSTADVGEHARPQWEWLFGCELRVVDRLA